MCYLTDIGESTWHLLDPSIFHRRTYSLLRMSGFVRRLPAIGNPTRNPLDPSTTLRMSGFPPRLTDIGESTWHLLDPSILHRRTYSLLRMSGFLPRLEYEGGVGPG